MEEDRGLGELYLREDDFGIWVLNGGDTAVGVEADVGFFLQIFEFLEPRFVGETELLEEDGDFPWVGARGVGVEDDCFSHLDNVVGLRAAGTWRQGIVAGGP